MNDAYEHELRGADDKQMKKKIQSQRRCLKKKKNHITTRPETYEVSPNFFCYLAAFGENCNSFQCGGNT